MNSIILLNWNELEVSKDSVRRLLKEPNLEVIIVDNGSTDGSKEYYKKIAGTVIVADKESKNGMKELLFKCGNRKLIFIDWAFNAGSSVARNLGISIAKGKNIFLLDGDILYVKGTIREYQKILDKYNDAYCVGQNSMEILQKTGHNGVTDPIEADFTMGTDYIIEDWFPMAWTQYGLFRGELLKKVKFTEIPPFNEAGYSLEDDWLHHEMTKLGYISLACSLPIYYHFPHRGYIELEKSRTENKMKERRQVFDKKWGKGNSWQEVVKRTNPKRITRPNPI